MDLDVGRCLSLHVLFGQRPRLLLFLLADDAPTAQIGPYAGLQRHRGSLHASNQCPSQVSAPRLLYLPSSKANSLDLFCSQTIHHLVVQNLRHLFAALRLGLLLSADLVLLLPDMRSLSPLKSNLVSLGEVGLLPLPSLDTFSVSSSCAVQLPPGRTGALILRGGVRSPGPRGRRLCSNYCANRLRKGSSVLRLALRCRS